MAPRYESTTQQWVQSVIPLSGLTGTGDTTIVAGGQFDGGSPSTVFGVGAAIVDAGGP